VPGPVPTFNIDSAWYRRSNLHRVPSGVPGPAPSVPLESGPDDGPAGDPRVSLFSRGGQILSRWLRDPLLPGQALRLRLLLGGGELLH